MLEHTPTTSCAAPRRRGEHGTGEVPSILEAGRRLAELDRVHGELGDRRDALRPGNPERRRLAAERDRMSREIAQLEEAILEADPATPAEAVVLLMVAASEINCGNTVVDGEGMVEAGELAVRRATKLLAESFGLDLEQFAGQRYLPAWLGAKTGS